MAVSYKKLWKLLIDKDLKKKEKILMGSKIINKNGKSIPPPLPKDLSLPTVILQTATR